MHLWWTDRDIMPFEEFVEDLQRRLRRFIQSIFLIETLDAAEPVGLIYTYNANLIDRYAYLCVYLAPEYARRGFGPEASRLFGSYLFQYYGFRKLYAEIIAYNQGSLRLARWNGFVQEGCLKEHHWFGDRYWDVHILSITKEEFLRRGGMYSD